MISYDRWQREAYRNQPYYLGDDLMLVRKLICALSQVFLCLQPVVYGHPYTE